MQDHNTPDRASDPNRGTLLTVEEAADYLHTSVRTMRRITAERLVPTVKFARRVLVWSGDLDVYIADNTRPAQSGMAR